MYMSDCLIELWKLGAIYTIGRSEDLNTMEITVTFDDDLLPNRFERTIDLSQVAGEPRIDLVAQELKSLLAEVQTRYRAIN